MQQRESHEMKLDEDLAALRLRGFVSSAHLMHQGAISLPRKSLYSNDLAVYGTI